MLVNLNIQVDQIDEESFVNHVHLENKLINDNLFETEEDGSLKIKTSVREIAFAGVNEADGWINHKYLGQITNHNLYIVEKSGDGIETIFYVIDHTMGKIRYMLNGLPYFSPNSDKIFVPNVELSKFYLHLNVTDKNKIGSILELNGYYNNFLNEHIGFIDKCYWVNNNQLNFSTFISKGFGSNEVKEFRYFKIVINE